MSLHRRNNWRTRPWWCVVAVGAGFHRHHHPLKLAFTITYTSSIVNGWRIPLALVTLNHRRVNRATSAFRTRRENEKPGDEPRITEIQLPEDDEEKCRRYILQNFRGQNIWKTCSKTFNYLKVGEKSKGKFQQFKKSLNAFLWYSLSIFTRWAYKIEINNGEYESNILQTNIQI